MDSLTYSHPMTGCGTGQTTSFQVTWWASCLTLSLKTLNCVVTVAAIATTLRRYRDHQTHVSFDRAAHCGRCKLIRAIPRSRNRLHPLLEWDEGTRHQGSSGV